MKSDNPINPNSETDPLLLFIANVCLWKMIQIKKYVISTFLTNVLGQLPQNWKEKTSWKLYFLYDTTKKCFSKYPNWRILATWDFQHPFVYVSSEKIVCLQTCGRERENRGGHFMMNFDGKSDKPPQTLSRKVRHILGYGPILIKI